MGSPCIVDGAIQASYLPLREAISDVVWVRDDMAVASLSDLQEKRRISCGTTWQCMTRDSSFVN
jgi:hypothetical protein